MTRNNEVNKAWSVKRQAGRNHKKIGDTALTVQKYLQLEWNVF